MPISKVKHDRIKNLGKQKVKIETVKNIKPRDISQILIYEELVEIKNLLKKGN